MIDSLIYFSVALFMFILGLLITMLVTPQKEMKLIKANNKAASIAYGGKLLGIALIIGAALENCVNVLDLIIFSALGILLQIITYFIFDLITFNIKFKDEIEKDNVSVGIMIAFVAISIGFIGGKALTFRPELEQYASLFLM